MMIELQDRLKHIGVELSFKSAVCDYIASKGEESGFGARPISRLIVNEVENKLTEILLNNKYENLKISVDVKDDILVFESMHQQPVVNNA